MKKIGLPNQVLPIYKKDVLFIAVVYPRVNVNANAVGDESTNLEIPQDHADCGNRCIDIDVTYRLKESRKT